jgi:hypothetical protein
MPTTDAHFYDTTGRSRVQDVIIPDILVQNYPGSHDAITDIPTATS